MNGADQTFKSYNIEGAEFIKDGFEDEKIDKLRKKDLNYDSNFNTYVYKGLPKGPICNPGKEAILAVTKPDDNDYLYFVANGLGGHNFSNNLKKHNENVKIYKNLKNN